MSFRRATNRHDIWTKLVSDYRDLLNGLPSEAVQTELGLREYLTRSTHAGKPLAPAVSELAPDTLHRVWKFLDHAQFDMDAVLFDDFNAAFRRTF